MTSDQLKEHWLSLSRLMDETERGSALWFDLDRAQRATGRLHVTMFGEAVRPSHSAGNGGRGMTAP